MPQARREGCGSTSFRWDECSRRNPLVRSTILPVLRTSPLKTHSRVKGGKGARYHAPKTMYGGFFAPLRSARNDGSGEGFPLGGSSAAGGDEEYVEKHVLPLIRRLASSPAAFPPRGRLDNVQLTLQGGRLHCAWFTSKGKLITDAEINTPSARE